MAIDAVEFQPQAVTEVERPALEHLGDFVAKATALRKFIRAAVQFVRFAAQRLRHAT